MRAAPRGSALVEKAMSQVGKPYRFGQEVRLDDPNPPAFDCSELVQWALAQIGVTFPDGSWNQFAACRGISLAQARQTPGALVFVSRNGEGSGVHHVGISRGDGYTVEARGAKWGVGVWAWRQSWNLAGVIPQLNYAAESAVRRTGQSGEGAQEISLVIGDQPLLEAKVRLIEGQAWVTLRPLLEFLGYEVHAPDISGERKIYAFIK